MGHAIDYLEFKEKEDKNIISAECNLVAIENGDYHDELCDIIQYKNKICDSYDEAVAYLDNLAKGVFYGQFACKFKCADNAKKTKSMENLLARINATHQKMEEYFEKNAPKNFKSTLVTCNECGSKVNKKFVHGYNCPVCETRGVFKSDTVKKTLKGYETKISELRHQYAEEEKILARKRGEVKWLVRIEYHV